MTPSASTSSRGQVQPIVALVLGVVAVAGLVAAVLVSRSGGTAGSPAASPTSRPSAAPSAAPTARPSAAPSSPVTGSGKVVLDNATNHDVTIQIHDETGDVVNAVSGKPGDGMSIRWHKAIVKNVDARTISVTWAGLPQDEAADLGITASGDKYELVLVQAGPYPQTDAMGEDRTLILTFDAPVAAEDLSIEILNRTVD
jgi:hypothetical protein